MNIVPVCEPVPVCMSSFDTEREECGDMCVISYASPKQRDRGSSAQPLRAWQPWALLALGGLKNTSAYRNMTVLTGGKDTCGAIVT